MPGLPAWSLKVTWWFAHFDSLGIVENGVLLQVEKNSIGVDVMFKKQKQLELSRLMVFNIDAVL